ncbi:MAG: hypothetical protein ACOC33_04180 [bacterium]
MIYNLNININLEMMGLSLEDVIKIQQEFMISMSRQSKISFDDLDKHFKIKDRPYFVGEMESPLMDRDDYSVSVFNLEIKG